MKREKTKKSKSTTVIMNSKYCALVKEKYGSPFKQSSANTGTQALQDGLQLDKDTVRNGYKGIGISLRSAKILAKQVGFDGEDEWRELVDNPDIFDNKYQINDTPYDIDALIIYFEAKRDQLEQILDEVSSFERVLNGQHKNSYKPPYKKSPYKDLPGSLLNRLFLENIRKNFEVEESDCELINASAPTLIAAQKKDIHSAWGWNIKRPDVRNLSGKYAVFMNIGDHTERFLYDDAITDEALEKFKRGNDFSGGLLTKIQPSLSLSKEDLDILDQLQHALQKAAKFNSNRDNLAEAKSANDLPGSFNNLMFGSLPQAIEMTNKVTELLTDLRGKNINILSGLISTDLPFIKGYGAYGCVESNIIYICEGKHKSATYKYKRLKYNSNNKEGRNRDEIDEMIDAAKKFGTAASDQDYEEFLLKVARLRDYKHEFFKQRNSKEEIPF